MNLKFIQTKILSNKKNLLWGMLSLILAFVILYNDKNPSDLSQEKQILIAITQIIEHPSLDQEREGILATLHKSGYVEGKNLKIIYQNAQGSLITAVQIAQKLVSLQPDVIVAISTPSAQSVLSAVGTHKIPIVFSAVSDPISAHLVKDLAHPGLGITGVSDYLAPGPQLKFIKKLVPHLKKIGVIYNPGESNSSILYQGLLSKALELKIHIVSATASRTSEVAAAAQSLIGKVDAIYVPNDNTAVSAIESVAQIATKHHLPLLTGDTGSVLRGALGVTGYNRKELGKAAGEKIVQFIKNGYSNEIPISYDHPLEITLNRDTIEKIHFQLPIDLLSNIQWVGGLK